MTLRTIRGPIRRRRRGHGRVQLSRAALVPLSRRVQMPANQFFNAYAVGMESPVSHAFAWRRVIE